MTLIERPPEEEMDRLLRAYGSIRQRVVDWDLRHLNEEREYPPCQGEVVLLVRDAEDRLAIVKKRSSPEHWVLPTGRIQEGETVEEAALREAREETGCKVAVQEVTALHRARIRFETWKLERWYFVVVCRLQGEAAPPEDPEEIVDVRFVELPGEVPVEWLQSEWYLWVLKDAHLLHPHAFLVFRRDAEAEEGSQPS